jgi:hypothetical protein
MLCIVYLGPVKTNMNFIEYFSENTARSNLLTDKHYFPIKIIEITV